MSNEILEMIARNMRGDAEVLQEHNPQGHTPNDQVIKWLTGYATHIDNANPKEDTPEVDTEALLVKMKKASSAVYLACEGSVADDISAMLKQAIKVIER